MLYQVDPSKVLSERIVNHYHLERWNNLAEVPDEFRVMEDNARTPEQLEQLKLLRQAESSELVLSDCSIKWLPLPRLLSTLELSNVNVFLFLLRNHKVMYLLFFDVICCVLISRSK